ncbi:neutral/alkaline non-lysosomal ceramidase N-terminal domain-containing protein [Planctomicrobium sp. SH527]|uniref:neutral/alkaline non-lysosomal ceramidase N-terminal domain-containing protein n=1 Tax=Planctomicrobium sp. SH527 TaxID=3448123 RepID=UPI003F5AF25C
MKKFSKHRNTLRCVWLLLLTVLPGVILQSESHAETNDKLQVGVAQVEITPPVGFPLADNYRVRPSTGTLDPLWAKAVYFRSGETLAAWVTCDLSGVSMDLSSLARERASRATGIPIENIVISATHSHTAPDFIRSLYRSLGPDGAPKSESDQQGAAYVEKLIGSITEAIVQAKAAAQPVQLLSGSAQQETQVSFCRRTVMQDGSVMTWVGLNHPQAVRTASPIDPEVGLIKFQRAADGVCTGLITNFGLHSDTTGGNMWSGDFSYAIEQSVHKTLGKDVISLFGNGCCGDVNHVDPTGNVKRKAPEIGQEIGETISKAIPNLTAIQNARMKVRASTVPLRLEEVTSADLQHSFELLKAVKAGQKIPFLEHVVAYKRLMLANLAYRESPPGVDDYISLGLSRIQKAPEGILPVKITVFTFGPDLAIVFLPGEPFTELGQSLKRASPYRTTLVIELSDCAETVYIPNRHAYAGGGYEVANSLVQPGSGERIVEVAVALLRAAAEEEARSASAVGN